MFINLKIFVFFLCLNKIIKEKKWFQSCIYIRVILFINFILTFTFFFLIEFLNACNHITIESIQKSLRKKVKKRKKKHFSKHHLN